MSDTIKQRIINIIAEQALMDPSDLHDDMTPAELGIDSLGLVETIFAIEEEFDIQIPFNANEPEKSDFDISTLGTIVAAAEKLVAENAA
ncbi:acyl carrier protein [Paracoccus pacificus]|uniref:Acyl carrier protein n=1 Tax=Paracoccus pacificus TaxID=1463598 RepID=A0ABW4R9K2_9RHOB